MEVRGRRSAGVNDRTLDNLCSLNGLYRELVSIEMDGMCYEKCRLKKRKAEALGTLAVKVISRVLSLFIFFFITHYTRPLLDEASLHSLQ